MAYTTVDQVAAMFPGFERNAANSVQDSTIQVSIDDVAGEINAVLVRRFAEAVGSLTLAAWLATLSIDAVNLLEIINRRGAGGELAEAFAAYGMGVFSKLAAGYGDKAQAMLHELNAEFADGKPKPQGGMYDKLFDPLAKTATPRAQLGGVAGGEMPDNETAQDEGLSDYFEKFGNRQE